MDSNRKGRECIIPDISRTYHFGMKGLNMNPYFQDIYFSKHALNRVTGVKFDISKVQKDNYEKEVHNMIKYVSASFRLLFRLHLQLLPKAVITDP